MAVKRIPRGYGGKIFVNETQQEPERTGIYDPRELERLESTSPILRSALDTARREGCTRADGLSLAVIALSRELDCLRATAYQIGRTKVVQALSDVEFPIVINCTACGKATDNSSNCTNPICHLYKPGDGDVTNPPRVG